ncbi:MAG: hypothetical protein HSCHL_2282 [Hydrogenibacillus schlegelii]|uniref:Uncharacterized protein n=1 Tax=Hydrogenibacillus schlegelii TaxID=1484 RepID=A0A2T5GES8_HYDSH|nr:MAG: hypothetical protein HSCHL_2282 [Hydrogenibacillus schlegelii]
MPRGRGGPAFEFWRGIPTTGKRRRRRRSRGRKGGGVGRSDAA